MVCHICEAAASLDCPVCRRGACSKHSERDPGGVRTDSDGRRSFLKTQAMICSACADDWRLDTAQIRKAYHCDFCGDHQVSDLTTTECAQCHRRFCREHGQVVTVGWFRFNDSPGWFRCMDHKVTTGTGCVYRNRLVFFLFSRAGQPDPQRSLEQEGGSDPIRWTS